MKLNCLLASVFVVAGCAEGADGPGKRFEIGVAPLAANDGQGTPSRLPPITEACYHLSVFNTPLDPDDPPEVTTEAAALVWDLEGVCAGRYGDKSGSITYIGTCDADGPGGVRPNTVRLALTGLWANTGTTHDANNSLKSPKDYANPCPEWDACYLQKDCEENADALVEFNLTVMRAAEQGFFDIAVDFEDLFCSAKFDCQYPDVLNDEDDQDEPINLLFDGAGHRNDTAVLGFACTSGKATATSAGETYLYMDDIEVYCDNGEGNYLATTLETSTALYGPGNQYRPAGDVGADEDIVFQYAIYEGTEFPEQSDFVKSYWNVAIGFNTAAMDGWNCTVTTKATASDADDFGNQGLANNTTEAGTVYPFISWNINVTTDGEDLLCGQSALTGRPDPVRVIYYDQSGVFIDYTSLPYGTESFDNCGHDEGSGFESFDGTCSPPSTDT